MKNVPGVCVYVSFFISCFLYYAGILPDISTYNVIHASAFLMTMLAFNFYLLTSVNIWHGTYFISLFAPSYLKRPISLE